VAGYPFNFCCGIESGPLVSVGQVWRQLHYKFSHLGLSLAVRRCRGAAAYALVIADRCRCVCMVDTITLSLASTTACIYTFIMPWPLADMFRAWYRGRGSASVILPLRRSASLFIRVSVHLDSLTLMDLNDIYVVS